MGNTIWKCERWNGSENYINKIEMPARPNVFYFDVRDYVSSDDARALADAIYNDLGLGWLPYPENEPETDSDYYWDKNGYYLCAIQNFDDPDAVFEFDAVLWFDDDRMKWMVPDGGYMPLPHLRVLKFRKIPD